MARIAWKEALRPALILAVALTLADIVASPRTGGWLFFAALKFGAFFSICYILGTLCIELRSLWRRE